MTGQLTHILRHPIKSIGWESLASVELSAGAILPLDRHWAVAHEAAQFDGNPDGWYAKRNFVRGVAAPQLMAVRAEMTGSDRKIRLSHPARPEIEIAPDTPQGSAALLDWIAPLWPDTRPAASRLVHAPDHPLSDASAPYVSILSLSSLRAFGQRAGRELCMHRFRGNLWLDGFEPWEEFDWIGKELQIGNARLRVEEPITRCNATKVDPETGTPDVDTLGILQDAFGHRDFGVFATVIEGGTLNRGDKASLT